MRIAIIGAGAAGCFCATHLGRLLPEATVEVFEAGSRPLAKVAITGGGRCNLTNSFRQVRSLQQVYPRGDKLMKRAFRLWDHQKTMEWFTHEGVPLVVQDDECVFPQSQDAMQIVQTLLRDMRQAGVTLHLSHRVSEIIPSPLEGEPGFTLRFADAKLAERRFQRVIVTIGGCPSLRQLGIFRHLGVEIQPPVPSLFTFNVPDPQLNALMGTVVGQASISLAGTRFRAQGPLLITHWGISGPAVLKLSSYAARHLHEQQIQGTVCINWMGEQTEDQVRDMLAHMAKANPQKQVASLYPQALSAKLWAHLLQRSQIPAQLRWSELCGKPLNRLCAMLTSCTYPISGKGKYKDEFVTCGGVSLSSINISTLQLKDHPGVYLAGEVLDVDAVTGGFNLQAAWSMAYVVANQVACST